MEFAILDIETSGGKPNESRIIEIAIIIHDGEKVIDTYETLVNPEKKIDWYVQKLTGNQQWSMLHQCARVYETKTRSTLDPGILKSK